ncbi:MAG: glutamine-hydrolyzing carbamoyl-phosphate synthase small subunit [Clostridia bacterium]|nr:glutamine-hydrolyzing carbamoyl-phosphate synthase small subunit [Clostridia bacterium]
MAENYNRKIILEDGSEYYGYGFGDSSEKVCEIVFNTSMVGYQEIVSDPSYTYQAVVMTYPLIGNYGICDDDYETNTPTIGALIVCEYNNEPSNFRSVATLDEIMKKHKIPGVYGIDTRKLTRSIRDFGSRKVLITNADTSLEKGLSILLQASIPTDAVSKVSCKNIWYSRVPKEKYHVVAIDCGMKQNIVRSLNKRGCSVTIVPWNTTAEQIKHLTPDGVFISNGPGDPADVQPVIETIKNLCGKYPIFGICLGHQIISLAYGAKTYKLKFGHRGGNHPVRNLETNKIEITSQNHSYAVDNESLSETRLTATHINILDNTIEGVKCDEDHVFSVQYHPESAPGPQDSAYLFDKFIEIMQEEKNNA